MSATPAEILLLDILKQFGELCPKELPPLIDRAQHGMGGVTGMYRQTSSHEFEDQEIRVSSQRARVVLTREFLSACVPWKGVYATIKTFFLEGDQITLRVSFAVEPAPPMYFGQRLPVGRMNCAVPVLLIKELSRFRGRYSDMEHIFHLLRIDMDHWIGVAGDGDNGCYEYFSLKKGVFECSNDGYGDTAVALREALVRYVE